MDYSRQLSSFDENGVLGQLSGIDEAQREKLFRRWIQELTEALDAATAPAQVEAARLHGVNGGESIRLLETGARQRICQPFPRAEASLLGQTSEGGGPWPAPELLSAFWMRLAYNGLWAPSGTNWQPVRSVALSADESRKLSRGVCSAPALAVCCRDRYESILGDIAALAGWQQRSRVEWVDLGIWLSFATATARGHGWRLEEQTGSPGLADGLASLLLERADRLSGPSRQAALDMNRELLGGKLRPRLLLKPLPGAHLVEDQNSPAGLALSPVDGLVEARASQRVASPEGDLKRKILEDLWRDTAAAPGLDLACFTWHDALCRGVGRAMHEGLEGDTGLVANIHLDNFRRAWRAMDGLPDDFTRWCREDSPTEEPGLPQAALPGNLCKRLCDGGLYRAEAGRLLDHRGKPVTPRRLIKLVRRISQNFGRYFLRFHNTHPLLGLLLTPADGDGAERQRLWLEAGRAVGTMSLLARARGLVSIIKSGPLEIAREGITELLAAHAPRPETRQALTEGASEILLTFQLGLPLGPDELVSAGEPDEHTGLTERQLDRRAGRAPLSTHHIPEAR